MFLIGLIFCFFINIKDFVLAKNNILLKNGVVLKKVSFKTFNSWENEDFNEALEVFIKSCDKFESFSNQKNIFPQLNQVITKNDLYSVCRIAGIIKNYNIKYKQVFFEKFFMPYQVGSYADTGIFTGYYIPIIKAKFKQDKIFKYPIYKKPDELESGTKYYSRKQIAEGVLSGRNLELLYTDDLIELFFAHIQGSANVFLVDENITISLVYDGKNNHKFSSIGQFLIKNNLIAPEQLNTIELKKYLKKNERFSHLILNTNDSYIFFKLQNSKIINGAFGTELINSRTIAVDSNIVPLGFPLWLETKQTTKNDIVEFNKIVIANDTGSAIKGANRGDIFFGYGEEAENIAGYQYSNGKYYLLIPEKIVRKL